MYGISDDSGDSEDGGNFEESSDESQQVVVPDTYIPLTSVSFDSLVSSVRKLRCISVYSCYQQLMINDQLL